MEGCGYCTVSLTVAEDEKMGAAMREKIGGGDKRLKTPLGLLQFHPLGVPISPHPSKRGIGAVRLSVVILADLYTHR